MIIGFEHCQVGWTKALQKELSIWDLQGMSDFRKFS